MAEQQFDVFLAHNSKDKPLIRQIYQQLKQRGLRPWLDEEEIIPGAQFQDEIQQAIGQIKAAAIFLGKGELGRWQKLELKSFITQCVNRNIRVIPVLLPGVEMIPEELTFLREFHAIPFDENIHDERALYRLEWGITGVKPKTKSQATQVTDAPTVAELSVPSAPVSPSKLTAPEPKLKSEKGIDYTRLRNLLEAGQWRDADQETAYRMLEAVGRDKISWIRPDELLTFPCADLKTIDALWMFYSGGKFGFSVQKEIWQECDSPTDSGEDWEHFCVRIGWKNDKANYVTYSELKANIDFSPAGEFPWGWWGSVRLNVRVSWLLGVDIVSLSSLTSRLINCE